MQIKGFDLRTLCKVYHLDGYPEARSQAYEIIDLLGDQFHDIDPLMKLQTGQNLIMMLSLLGKLEGKRILDLGCGSIFSEDGISSGIFEPWLCRALARAGAKPIGIDIEGFLEKEPFEGHGIDLMKTGSLDFIAGGTVDLAFARSLFDSPKLHDSYGYGAGARLYKTLLPQLERVVKQEGYFLFETLGAGVKANFMR